MTAAAYRSFRAPTLNELHRGFRVGDVVTEPNDQLGPERLTGAELGGAWSPAGEPRRRWRLRTTAFWMELDDAIANVTTAVEDGLIRRQRRNVARTRSRGIELEAHAELGSRWSLRGGYQGTDAEVRSFPGERELEGKRVSQVPAHQATLGLAWRSSGLELATEARWQSDAFDDDRETLALGELTVVDLQASRALGAHGEVFVAVENLFDEVYTVGRTPLTTVGSPRLVRLGWRWRSRGG